MPLIEPKHLKWGITLLALGFFTGRKFTGWSSGSWQCLADPGSAFDAIIESALSAIYGERAVSLQQLAATFRRGDLLEFLG